MVVVERVEERREAPRFGVRHLQRWKAAQWSAVLNETRRLLARPPLRVLPPTITVDVTQGGTPLVDLCDRALADQVVLPVLVTGAQALPNEGQRPARVATRELLGALQIPLQSERLLFARHALTETLVEQLRVFQRDRAQADPVSAAITSPGVEADLAQALSVCLWTMSAGLFEGYWDENAVEFLDRQMPESFQSHRLRATLSQGGTEMIHAWLERVHRVMESAETENGVAGWAPAWRRARKSEGG
jgi:hypothetical protein